MITASEFRAGRALLRLSRSKLAEMSGLSVATIERLERGDRHAAGDADSRMALADALIAAGVEVIEEGAASLAGGRGLRLRSRPGDRDRIHQPVATDFPLVGPHTD